MSDLNEEIVAIANEYRRLQRQLDSKTAQLQSLLETNAEAGDFPTDFLGAQNRRYSIDFNFKAALYENNEQIQAGDLQPQERSVTVESGTIFRCAYMESFVKVIGSTRNPYDIDGPRLDVQITLPWDQRLDSFDYFWRVRDTGTDREWVDQPQHSMFGGGGYVGPLWFPRRIVLGGGTTIFATVAPFLNKPPPILSDFAGTQQYTLQISFVGHEVPDGSAL